MKIIKNKADAVCLECLVSDSAVLVDGRVVCRECGQWVFIDSTGGLFQPVFIDDPAATYQVNKYTPKLKDRRIMNRAWPKFKERRKSVLMVG